MTTDSDVSTNVMHPVKLTETAEGNGVPVNVSTPVPSPGEEWTKVEKRKVKKARKLEVSDSVL